MRVHRLVGQLRTDLRLGVHTQGGTVDDDVVFFHHLGGDRLILDGVRTLIATDEDGLQSQMLQTVVDGFRCTTRTQNERFLVPLLLEHGLYALRETDDVTVVAFQLDVLALVNHLNHVDGTNGSGFRRYAVEVGYHLLFIGDGDIQPFELRIGVQHLVEGLDGRNLKVFVHSIDAFVLETLVEIADRERVA